MRLTMCVRFGFQEMLEDQQRMQARRLQPTNRSVCATCPPIAAKGPIRSKTAVSLQAYYDAIFMNKDCFKDKVLGNIRRQPGLHVACLGSCDTTGTNPRLPASRAGCSRCRDGLRDSGYLGGQGWRPQGLRRRGAQDPDIARVIHVHP